MFRLLILQALCGLSDEQTEFQIRDRLSFMRFLGLGPGNPVPDATTIWVFGEQLTKAGAIEKLFARFDRLLADKGVSGDVRPDPAEDTPDNAVGTIRQPTPP